MFPFAWGAALAAALTMEVRWRRKARLWIGWEFWPETSAIVELASVGLVGARRKGGGPFAVGELSYSYSANGTYYSGTCYRRFATEAQAEEGVARCRGKALSVRYNPRQPELSYVAGFADDSELSDPWLPQHLFRPTIAFAVRK